MTSTAIADRERKVQGQGEAAVWLKRARQWHLWLGTLFAPTILFFALTGAVQLFGLHEGHPGSAYQPPAWLQRLASLHKDQVVSEHKGPPPGASRQGEQTPQAQDARRDPQPENGPGDKHGPGIPTMALKWFFLAAALGLSASTLLGIYMAFRYNRSRVLVWGLLFVGTAVPVALIAMMT